MLFLVIRKRVSKNFSLSLGLVAFQDNNHISIEKHTQSGIVLRKESIKRSYMKENLFDIVFQLLGFESFTNYDFVKMLLS